MANAITFDYVTELSGTVSLPANRGVFTSSGLVLFQRQSLPTDPIGIFTLTLTGVVIGSAIQVQAADGTPLHNEVATATTEVINLQAYAPGSPLNDLRIKVRKGSAAPFYQPFLTQTLAVKGSQTIFVSQIPDE